jgi:hypothetical protein
MAIHCIKGKVVYFLLPTVLILATCTAKADNTDTVSQSGVWGALCPSIACSKPGDVWSYSFKTAADLKEPPDGFPASAVSDFDYYLNGKPVKALTVSNDAVWFPDYNDGGFFLSGLNANAGSPCATYNICNDIAFGLFYQLYATPRLGQTSQIPLIPGSYELDRGFEDFFGGCFGPGCGVPQSGVAGPIVIAADEPRTLYLLLTGLLALTFVMAFRYPLRARL